MNKRAGTGGAWGKIPTVWYAYVHVHIKRRGASRGLDGRDEVGLDISEVVGVGKECGGRANGRAAAWRSGGGALCSIRHLRDTLFPSSLRLRLALYLYPYTSAYCSNYSPLRSSSKQKLLNLAAPSQANDMYRAL